MEVIKKPFERDIPQKIALPLGDSVPAQRNEKEVQENKSSCHNSVTECLMYKPHRKP